jgi:hypothetical protein
VEDTVIKKQEYTIKGELDWIFIKPRDRYELEAVQDLKHYKNDSVAKHKIMQMDQNEAKKFLKFIKEKR